MRYEVRIDVTHLPGVLDPQGATVERALPALGYDNVSEVSIAKTIRLVLDADPTDAARAQVDEMCRRLLANPVIERYTVEIDEASSRERRKVGVVVFPGTNCELDVVWAVEELGGEAELLWHGDRTRRRRRRGRRARRVRARRLPAHRCDRPLLAGDGRGRRVRRRRRPGRRDLQRLPGAHRGGPAPRRAAEERRAHVRLRHRRARGREHASVLTHRRRARRDPAHPDQPLRGQLRLRLRDARPGSGPTTASSCATSRTPTAASTTSPASATRPATSSG